MSKTLFNSFSSVGVMIDPGAHNAQEEVLTASVGPCSLQGEVVIFLLHTYIKVLPNERSRDGDRFARHLNGEQNPREGGGGGKSKSFPTNRILELWAVHVI